MSDAPMNLPGRDGASALDASAAHTKPQTIAREALMVGTGVLTIALCAQVSIPSWPAPFTLQTFAVVLIAACYGPWRGTATIGSYLAAGACGLPVFAGLASWGAFLTGSSGYLFGFAAAGLVVGGLMHAGFAKHWSLTVVAMTLGTLTILACGVAWLVLVMKVAPTAAIMAQGQYLPGAAAKILLAVAALPFARRALAAR